MKDYLKEHPEVLVLAAIMAVSLLLRLAFLHEPFDRDEGQYAAIAQTILRGGLPYRDAIEIKPPGAFYLYAIGIGLFGATTEAFRIFTAVYSLCTVGAVYAVARRLAGTRGGLWAALLYGIYSTFPMLQGSGSNTEVFLVLPLTAGFWFFLRNVETGKRSDLFWVGLCAAAALLIKPQALLLVAIELLGIPFARKGASQTKESALDAATFMVPLIGGALLTFGYFFLRDGLGDCIYWTVQFPHCYAESQIDFQRLFAVMQHLFSSLLVPVLIGVPSAAWFAAKRRDLIGSLPLLSIVAIFLAIALPGKYYPHYFIMLVPFLAIAGGVGLANLNSMPRPQLYLPLFILAAAVLYSVLDNYRFYTVYSPNEVSVEKYHVTSFVESPEVARYLREHTKPEDYIFQWGFEPELYFLTGRRPANPYLVSILPSWSEEPREAVQALLQSLVEKKPPYVVVQPEWADFPGADEVAGYLQKNCVVEKKIGYADIYRCNAR